MLWINWFVKQTPLCSLCPSFKRTTKARSTETSSSLWARKSVELGPSTWTAARAHLRIVNTLKPTVRGPVASHSIRLVLSPQSRCRGLVSSVSVQIWNHCVVSRFMISNLNVVYFLFFYFVNVKMQQLSSRLQKSWEKSQPSWSTVLWLRPHRTWGRTFWPPPLM